MTGKSPIVIPQEVGSPYIAYTNIQSIIRGFEQSLQAITSLYSDPFQEGKSCNLREGEGETSGTAKAEPQLYKQGSPVIPDLGSAAKPSLVANSLLTKKHTLKFQKVIGTSLMKWKTNHLNVKPQH